VAAAMKVCAQEQEHDDHGYVLQLNCVHVAAALSPWLAAHTAAAGHECSEAAVHQFIVANSNHRNCNNEYKFIELMQECWASDTKQRPTADQLWRRMAGGFTNRVCAKSISIKSPKKPSSNVS